MNQVVPDSISVPEWAEISQIMQEVAEKSLSIYQSFLSKQSPQLVSRIDSSRFTKLGIAWAQALAQDPQPLLELQQKFWQDWTELTQKASLSMLSGQAAEVSSENRDKRFFHELWQAHPYFGYLRDSYQLFSEHMLNCVKQTQGLESHTQQQLDFFTRQYLDALSPSNFPHTNPVVLRETLTSGGENLLRGLRNLLSDMERSTGTFKIRMTDESAFVLGENIAATEGAVVFENHLIQLIQYAPQTAEVSRCPLLIIPPWINKYYVLDLQPDKSLVRWLVEQGQSVFLISWVNPGPELSELNFEDYIRDGVLAALKAVEAATGELQVNTIGYCIGGTLLATTLAYLHYHEQQQKVRSATFLTTLTDFAEPGELSVFIDQDQVNLAKVAAGAGIFDGDNMALVFSSLRANDLIWNFVINNYLLGKEPFPFDLLYWNSDSTRMSAAMHSYYLENMYLYNRLVQPGALTMLDTPIDLSKVTTPSYFLSTRDDHIAPWKSTYATVQLFCGARRFVLGESGHIAGVVNHPSQNKYGYWTYGWLPEKPDDWQSRATRHAGSWWVDWQKWVKRYSGGKPVPARQLGEGGVNCIEPAPGRYVRA